MKQSILSRIIFLLTGFVAGYKITSGMANYSILTTTLYTVSFGVLLLACLLLLLLGFEILENNYIAIISALIPITLSLGLVADKLDHSTVYSVLIGVSFIIAVILKLFSSGKVASLSLAVIHFLSGSVIFFLPIVLFFTDRAEIQILMISFGGVLIGSGGMLLGLAKARKIPWGKEQILSLFPILLFITTVAFVAGLAS